MPILQCDCPLDGVAKSRYRRLVCAKYRCQGVAQIAWHPFHRFSNGIFCGRRGSRAFPRRIPTSPTHPPTLALAEHPTIPPSIPHRCLLQLHRPESVSVESLIIGDYLPIQNFEKIDPKISSTPISPVIPAKARMPSRKWKAIKSPVKPLAKPSSTLCISVAQRSSDSA